jgi:hypothetical protein
LIRAALADPATRSVSDLVAATGLTRDLVDAGLEHLLFTGELRAEPLASGCPAAACGTCAVRHGCTAARAGRGRLLTARL